MKLVRIAILYLKAKESDWIENSWRVELGDVEISSQRIGKSEETTDKQRQLVFASIKLDKYPERTADNYLVIPKEERKKTEHAIETLANMFSVIERCQRSISSPTPCIAFLPENKDDSDFLESTVGIYKEQETTLDMEARFKLSFDESTINSFSDRLSGVALLAEALAHNNATGKYHEFVRLYELAFLVPVTQLDKKLSKFLSESALGYTRDEVNQWIKFRHPATHADLRRTQEIVFEADIVRYIPRMEQAAYDLLLNKANWQASDTNRRNIWKPDVATISSEPGVQLTQGQEAKFGIHVYDQFNSYPLNLKGFMSSLPAGLWSK